MNQTARVALDGEYDEAQVPLLLRRRGMAEWADGRVRILDRRGLPATVCFIECRSVEEVAIAIESMAIQGAFTLSLAAGYGLALVAASHAGPLQTLPTSLDAAARRLVATRPTGLALSRMVAECIRAAQQAGPDKEALTAAIVATVDARAQRLARQALATARHALPLIANASAILTHCFADRSLLYLLLEARRAGRTLDVYCSETRPYLQGARLTAPAVLETGHRATVITDGSGGLLMRSQRVQAFLTAADRVCTDGTICNKIGTYPHALAARANGIPYYVLRQSGPDFESAGEDDIKIEFRNRKSVLEFMGIATSAGGVDALYPAFDVTPPDLVTKIVTDQGVFDPRAIDRYRRAELGPDVGSGAPPSRSTA
jgi:methylthioribose-1-phosphate isomerase